MNDVIIIGGGPAGVTLSLYLKRNNFDSIVFTNKSSALLKANQIDNYYGVRNISGEELYNIGIKQLEDFEIPVINEEVVKIEKNENFIVHTNIKTYESKIVVLATGIIRQTAKNLKVSDFEGKGISYCATCDGFFYRNKKIGVVGTGNLAFEEIKHLLNITNDVTLYTNNDELKSDFSSLNIKINTKSIKSLKGNDRFEGFIFEDETEEELDGLFVAIGTASANTFSKSLGIEMNNSFVKVDENYMTNVDSLYAIGDVVGGVLQIGKAIADGILTSKVIIKKLKENK